MRVDWLFVGVVECAPATQELGRLVVKNGLDGGPQLARRPMNADRLSKRTNMPPIVSSPDCRCPRPRAEFRTRLISNFGTTVGDVSGQPPDVGGMTVNERLFTAGLIGEFDAAINAGDRHRAIELLKQAAVSEDSAATTVDAVLANPSKYGYPRPSLK